MPDITENITPLDAIYFDQPVPENLKNLTEDQITQVIADSQLADLRAHRTQLLNETDWTQNPDVPQSTKEKWAAYRQALRDITINYKSLNGVDWPIPPN